MGVMERVPVVSSNIESVGFDPETRVLELEFHHGAVYRYEDVPPALVVGMMRAPSVGAFFTKFIKNSYIGIRE